MDYATRPSFRASRDAFDAARALIPSGVNSTARSVQGGWSPYPLFVRDGRGSRVTDIDGNTYLDYLLGLGPMIFGHRPPEITRAVVDYIENVGTMFAMPTLAETALAGKIVEAVPSVEQVHLTCTGTEGVLYAVRLARAYTGRSKVVRFEGMYHGFSDGVYWSKHPDIEAAGPDDAPVAVAQGAGLPPHVGESLVVLPWNDVEALRSAFARNRGEIAAVLTEPIMCNTGCILPEPGYLEAMRELCSENGALLVFDEVITGFRVARGGAQSIYGISPDLTVFAKGLGGGFPVAALGGRRDVLALVDDGIVSMAGTYSANGIAVAAASAALDLLADDARFDALWSRSTRLREGLQERFDKHAIAARVVGIGPLFQVWFTEQPIRNYRDAARHADQGRFRLWWEAMLERNVLFHPGPLENLFVSFAHSDDDVDATLEAAASAIDSLAASW
ncbi:MAG: glutamate-1-semialdehyde 2,1-aminomutase [Actinomycetota bacterium]|nr:glutamate-1-semialdehyde 2,1-aminomutase [Actinomycetota bacterium]